MIDASNAGLSLMAISGPIMASVAEMPETMLEGTASTVMGAVGLAILQLLSVIRKHIEGLNAHHEQERAEWRRAAEHRDWQRSCEARNRNARRDGDRP